LWGSTPMTVADMLSSSFQRMDGATVDRPDVG
jgi:hypothetical protein